MSDALSKKYSYWITAFVLAVVFLFIGGVITGKEEEVIPDEEKVKITANVPSYMEDEFTDIFEEHKFEKEYILEFTDSKTANIVVTEGLDKGNGELFVYTPFLAVMDDDSDVKDFMAENGYLVDSTSAHDYYDLDFKKIMEEFAKGNDSSFRVYYPEEDSNYWDEFYIFLLTTANNGTYPKNETDMKAAKELVSGFLSNSYAVPFSKNAIKQIQSIPLYTMYFMTYVDYKDYFGNSDLYTLRYPKAVVNHNYYISYDETGKVMYDALSYAVGMFGSSGFSTFYNSYYNTVENDNICGSSAGVRNKYNSISIPENLIKTSTQGNSIKIEETPITESTNTAVNKEEK